MKNWYQVLQISAQASEAEIKAAYRKLAKENHPDADPGNTDRAEKFTEISEAYRVLSDQEKRKAFDEEWNGTARTSQRAERPRRQSEQTVPDIDFHNIHQSFESFFGFNPETKDVVNEEKLMSKSNAKNPLDVSDLFDKFMGIKR